MPGPNRDHVRATVNYFVMGVLTTVSGIAGGWYAARSGSWLPLAAVAVSAPLWYIGGTGITAAIYSDPRRHWFAKAGAPASALVALSFYVGMPWVACVVPALCSVGCLAWWALVKYS